MIFSTAYLWSVNDDIIFFHVFIYYWKVEVSIDKMHQGMSPADNSSDVITRRRKISSTLEYISRHSYQFYCCTNRRASEKEWNKQNMKIKASITCCVSAELFKPQKENNCSFISRGIILSSKQRNINMLRLSEVSAFWISQYIRYGWVRYTDLLRRKY